MDMIEKIGLILLGAVISLVIYLVKRKLENKPQLETLEKHKKLLDIHRKMNDQGIDIKGLRELEEKLNDKAEAIQSNVALLQSESKPIVSNDETEELSQTELNIRATELVEEAKNKLQETIAAIDGRIGDDESQALMNSQIEWERYSRSQAEVAASGYKGGSIYSFIYGSELESLTNERTARLKEELNEIMRLRG
ncbi:MAG: lysozyme inhibitor LprI family protein [Methylococcales bacterium]